MNPADAHGLDRVGQAGQHYERMTNRLVDAELDLKLTGERWESDPSEAHRAEAFEACAKALALLESTINAVDEYLAVAGGVLPQQELDVVGYGRAEWQCSSHRTSPCCGNSPHPPGLPVPWADVRPPVWRGPGFPSTITPGHPRPIHRPELVATRR